MGGMCGRWEGVCVCVLEGGLIKKVIESSIKMHTLVVNLVRTIPTMGS